MSRLDDIIVERVRAGKFNIPPYPATAARLASLVQDPNYRVDDVVGVLRHDPALAASVLRVANSVLYARSGPVTALVPAVTRLGAREVSRLALVGGVRGSFDGPGPLVGLRRKAWRSSLLSALICEQLAPGEEAGEAFVAGLLHDVGQLLCVALLEDFLRGESGEAPRPEGAWWRIVNRFHLEVGTVLSAMWKLPAPLDAVIRLHHEPNPAEGLQRWVQASDEVAELLDEDPLVTEDSLKGAWLLREAERARLAATLPGLPEFVEAFALDSRGGADSHVTPDPGPPSGGPSGWAVKVDGIEMKVLAFTQNALAVETAEHLGKHTLRQVELTPDFKMCMRVAEVGESWAVIHPYVLGGPDMERWRALLARHTA